MPEQDAVLVKVAREAGAIVLAKTNVPQTLLSPMETTNALFGTTRNPFHLDHAPGGSSGGEGAALASGTSVLGIGTDIGGSIRSPAAFCGVAGLKPTVHRWSNRGSNGVMPGQEAIRSQTGPLARTAEDVALLFGAVDPLRQAMLDPAVPPLPAEDPSAVDLSKLRVGVYDDDGFLTPCATVRRAVRMAADALERAGAEVIPYQPPHTEEMTFLYFALMGADGFATLRDGLAGEPTIDPLKTVYRISQLPDTARRALGLAARTMGERRVANLLSRTGEKRVQALWGLTARRTQLVHAEMAAWDQQALDAVLCPAQVTPACPHGMSHDFTMSISYVARANLLNLPAGVVPVTRVRPDETQRDKPRDRIEKRAALIEAQGAGLPVGVQVMGRAWREATVLRVMQAIEGGVRTDAGFPRTPVDLEGGTDG
jgi:fatty acid amide hydrolase